MKQLLQNLRSGETSLVDLPCPQITDGSVLIRSTVSLLSSGTERMIVKFGKANLVEKALQQPDKVRAALDKVRADGVLETFSAINSKLDQPVAMGYCNVGRVLAVGRGVVGLRENDRVASNGQHAEIVRVPANLCAAIPDAVGDEDASLTVVGAIALQGIRLAAPTLGEAFVVIGLGLIGLLTVQILRANGCRVLGIDLSSERLALAREFGAEIVNPAQGEDCIAAGLRFSRGRGVDGAIITASTNSNEPIHDAAVMCRKRGRIVLVGIAGLHLSRADFYEKELSLQVSCSYGPGRYDAAYEEMGHDYPFGFVRWTEQRNLEAVLDMLAEGRLSSGPLITHRFAFANAERAYGLISGTEHSLGVLLKYPSPQEESGQHLRAQTIVLRSPRTPTPRPTVAFIGSGNYASRVLIPAFKKANARLKIVASSGGISAVRVGRKFGFEASTSDADAIFADDEIDAVVIATRHDSHADLVCKALRARKHVFVEKPLAIDREGLARVEATYADLVGQDHAPIVMVGFNRRFAPHIQRINALIAAAPLPKAFVMTINAGAIPTEHWTQDAAVGGGRIIGEACHFIDLLRFLAASPIATCKAARLGDTTDSATITLEFTDGSLGTVHYLANGNRAFPKERLEIFAGGAVLQLDNFRRLRGYGWRKFSRMNLWRQDKGQRACAATFVRALETMNEVPIPLEELLEVTDVTLRAAEMLRC